MFVWQADARRYELYRLDGELCMRVYLWVGDWIREYRGPMFY